MLCLSPYLVHTYVCTYSMYICMYVFMFPVASVHDYIQRLVAFIVKNMFAFCDVYLCHVVHFVCTVHMYTMR